MIRGGSTLLRRITSIPGAAADFARKVPPLRFAGQMVDAWRAKLLAYSWGARDVSRYNRANHHRRRVWDRPSLQAEITKAYHGLEKGLSLSEPRAGFGVPNASRLARLAQEYIDLFGPDEFIGAPVHTLHDFLSFQERQGVSLPGTTAAAAQLMEQIGAGDDIRKLGGIEHVTGKDIRQATQGIDFESFLSARHSIRHFTADPVDRATLLRAVELAQLAPSACNRQGARAYIVDEPEMARRVLAVQPGNRGFGDKCSCVIAVAGRDHAFSGPGERNQSLIDGSLFAMTLVYALHSMGLGTCMLAWSVSPKKDKEMASLIGLDPADRIVMLIAVGHLPDELRVPVSYRFPVEQMAVLVADEANPKS